MLGCNFYPTNWLLAAVIAGQVAGRCAVASDDSATTAAVELKYDSPKLITGAIYDTSPTKKLLFQFKRRASQSGDKLSVEREYCYPDGTLAATEKVVYDGNQLVLYELKDLQDGARGIALIERKVNDSSQSEIRFDYASEPGAKSKKGTEHWVPNILINDMVGRFLRSHWNSLMRGEKVNCRYIVVSRRETIGFTFVKTAESRWEGRDAILVKMEPTSPLLLAVVKPVTFTLEAAEPHRVLQYSGRTTPKVKDGAKWKELDAVTVFDWDHAQP